jgi:hypothetical protein
MGSFTELTLAFTFAPGTPPEVLGAFRDWRNVDDGPELPTLEDSLGDDEFEADLYLGNHFGAHPPPVASLPLLHRASLWRYLMQWGETAYFPGTPATVLRWDRYGAVWTLTTRALPKESADWVRAIIAPLGEWASDGSSDRPRFVGYIIDEYTPRPVLMWSVGGQPFRFEGDFEQA